MKVEVKVPDTVQFCIRIDKEDELHHQLPIGSFVREKADTLITFSDIESLDVLIERLQKLKAMMCGELEDCGETLEYDY